MPLQRPRRIFRPSFLPRLGPAILRAAALVAVAVAVAGAGSLAWREGKRALRATAAAAPPAGEIAAADPSRIAVIDGATLRIDQQVVRLLGVEPPTRGESCGNKADCGSAAANALAGLVNHKPISCTLRGKDRLGHPLAVCDAAGTDLGRAVIAAGWARADDEMPELVEAERGARANRRGLWADP